MSLKSMISFSIFGLRRIQMAHAMLLLVMTSGVFADETEQTSVTKTLNRVARTVSAMRSSDSSSVLIAAHRGGYRFDKQDGAPENSIENIRNCERRGYDLYETDIQLTKDGHFVIVHDPTIDRETTGSGNVNDISLANLTRLRKRYRDGTVSESRVATLAEFLDEGKGCTVFKADLKPGVCERFDQVLGIVKEKEALDGIVFRAFYRDLPTLVAFRRKGVAWPRGMVMFRVKNRQQLDHVVSTLNPSVIHIDVVRDDPANEETLQLIRYASDHGLHVQVHAEGTADHWRQLYDAGARMFHTTKPDEFAVFRDSLQERQTGPN